MSTHICIVLLLFCTTGPLSQWEWILQREIQPIVPPFPCNNHHICCSQPVQRVQVLPARDGQCWWPEPPHHLQLRHPRTQLPLSVVAKSPMSLSISLSSVSGNSESVNMATPALQLLASKIPDVHVQMTFMTLFFCLLNKNNKKCYYQLLKNSDSLRVSPGCTKLDIFWKIVPICTGFWPICPILFRFWPILYRFWPILFWFLPILFQF